jgi:hypothetical protein
MLRIAVAPFDGSRRTRMIVSDRGLMPALRSSKRRSEPRHHDRLRIAGVDVVEDALDVERGAEAVERVDRRVDLEQDRGRRAAAVRKTIVAVAARNRFHRPHARRGGSRE